MKNKTKIHYKIRSWIIVSVVVTIFVTAYLMTFMLNRISNRVSSQFAQMYSSEVVNEIESFLSREIALAEQLAKTDVIQSWFLEEDDFLLKREAYKSASSFSTTFSNHNVFLVPDASKNMYFLTAETNYTDFNALGTLSDWITDDAWYFDMFSKIDSYRLNIDRDRFIEDRRIWINVNVVNDDRVVGILGTGLYLDRFIDDILNTHDDGNAISYIIDHMGNIQIASKVKDINQDQQDASIYQYSDGDDAFKKTVEDYIWSDLSSTIIQLTNSASNYDYAAFERLDSSNWHVVTDRKSVV